jgi:hypothetical protein
MFRVVVGLALLALMLVAGCGGDDERAETTPEPPELTVPRSEPETTPTETTQSAPGQDPATAPAPQGEGDGSTPAPQPTPQDSPQNDTPPPANSPAERFERECERNPEACG